MAGSGTPLEGWYSDPNDPGLIRWWDGRDWTSHVRHLPLATQPTPPVAAAVAIAPVPALPAVAEVIPVDGVPLPIPTEEPPPAVPVGPPSRSLDILTESAPAETRSMPSRRTLAIVAAATVAVLAVAGIGAKVLGTFSSDDSTAAGAGTTVQPVAMAPNVAPKVGQCFVGASKVPATGAVFIGSLKKLPCAQQHDLEVYALATYVGPLPTKQQAALAAAGARCPSPEAYVADHFRWAERFGTLPIVGTAAKGKAKTWLACGVVLGKTAGGEVEAVSGSVKGVISAPGAMAKYGVCTPSRPAAKVATVPCAGHHGMYLVAVLPIATAGGKYPGAAAAAALSRKACATFAGSVKADPLGALVGAPTAAEWAAGRTSASCFISLDGIPGSGVS